MTWLPNADCNGMDYSTERKHQRFKIKLPILVNGLDETGCYFEELAKTVNGCPGGLAVLLKHQPKMSSYLEIYVSQGRRLGLFPTQVRHISTRKGKTTVGVKFLDLADPHHLTS